VRRSAQLGDDGALQQSAVDGELEEMPFSGGALNLKLVGGSSTEHSSAAEALFPLPSSQKS
jgi:hypothetical protein